MRKVALAAALVAAALVPAVSAAPAPAQTPLTVYASVPTHGPARAQTTDLLRGARLALQHAGGQAGGRPVRLVELSSSSRRAGGWTPELVSRNARRAAVDDSAIAYLGEFNSGATAISLPILNEAGVLMVSPSSTATGLTIGGPGADLGEPAKYYPAEQRTFGRVVPNDAVLARAAAATLQADGIEQVLIVSDGTLYGSGLAQRTAAEARKRKIAVQIRRLAKGARNRASIARATRIEAVFYAGTTASGAVPLWKALYAHDPLLSFYAGEGVSDARFTRGIPRRAARETHLLVTTPPAHAFGAAAQPVLAQLGTGVDPYALYGYEAMAVTLDAIARGGGTRPGTIAAFFATRDRASVLGRYSIDPNGDTSLTTVARYGITTRGSLRYAGLVDAGPPVAAPTP